MPRAKKPAGQAVDPRNGKRAELAVVPNASSSPGTSAARPTPPAGIRAEARRLWEAYWDDALSGVVRPSEYALVRRWVANWNRYLIVLGAADDSPFVQGSTGQTVIHPGYKLALQLESSIRADEAQLGWGPKNRTDLGLALTEGQRSLADLNKQYGGGDGGVATQQAAGHAADLDDDPRRTG